MKNKRIFKTLSALCAALVLMGVFSVTAFAQGPEQPPAEDATNDTNVVEETEDSPTLTPEGNAALVDDFGGNKQLITVTTKAGNYFYILIDRANEDKETAVHFLNQVDEADLMALMEDGQSAEKPPAVCNCTEKCEAGAVNTKCEVCSTDMTGCTGKKPEPPKEPTEPEKKEPAGLNPAVLLLVLAMMGGAAFAQGTEELPAEDATNDSNVVVEETEDSPALTPDGNAALVDDFGDNKQLITVTTKAGNYFYILIDRANEDKETAVHFLNRWTRRT